ncbi:hypothetical protein C5E08_08350 [Rathayibacter iranicus]|uniref:Cation-transporting ATPase n=1 Tax=Rathayibacter iranicus TaxID=59737 RepID=A0AAD1EMV4_9MICO|nr:hypothetical protein C7V51_08385 [Rathayibacter iranicus]PPI47213.1 hypothetical protein C5E09_07420 [Rathayibacter iranicus]PPI60256.1 hypothetical protein C5E08_08350 [Rathayibacter iranicus]PPI71721.1 hypothetical protein C5E01_07390 [Rathayibacter iranicus]
MQGKYSARQLVRTAADTVTGDSRTTSTQPRASTRPQDARPEQSAPSQEDRAAIARYDYLLRTADREQLEQVHRESFAKLTPVQRAQVEERLREELPANEQPWSSAPEDLARAATRAEATSPGFLRRMFSVPGGRSALAGVGGGAAGIGIGAAGGLFAAVPGGAVMSSVAGPLLAQAAEFGADVDSRAGDLGDITGGAGDAVSGAEEQMSGLGQHVSEFGSDISLPGLGDLGSFFDR